MRCKLRLLKFGTKASDGSVISMEVVKSYLDSPEFKEDLEAHRMIGSLTHRVRNIAAQGFSPETTANLKKTIAKDDGLLLPDSPCSPTHYVDKMWIEDGALWGEAQIFDEEGFDDSTIQAIRRLKSLLKSGVSIGVSLVVVGYWENKPDGTDWLGKLVKLKGFDYTLSPSFPGSYVMDVMDDEGNSIRPDQKTFSNVEDDLSEDIMRVKCFSDLSKFEVNSPKTSKIDNKFTFLKAKSFSFICPVDVDSQDNVKTKEPEQKEFSQAHVLERMRLTKLSPRIRFRRIIIDFRQALKSQGGIEKISPESLKTLKSLFATDVLGILQEITPMILQGKNLNALLGASSLGVSVRKASQELSIPLRLALMENKRSGFVSKARYQKIQDAYTKFVNALLEYVFGTPTNQKLKEEEEDENEKS